MHTLTVSQTASALARLEGLHTMLTLDEAIEVVTGTKPPLVQRIRKKTTNLWRDVGYAAAAPIRKTEDAIDGEWMIPESALELLLRRCRRVVSSRSWEWKFLTMSFRLEASALSPPISAPS
jgi:hypothetical protein